MTDIGNTEGTADVAPWRERGIEACPLFDVPEKDVPGVMTKL